MSEKIIAYKGFDKNFVCNPDGVPFQYEVGQTYTLAGPVKACRSGFHACEHPLNVFGYYAPATSRFAVVEMGGETSRDGSDTKVAAAEITIKAELKLPELIARAIDYVFSRVTYEKGSQATGTRGAASATGDQGAASATGDQGAASATGTQGAASATGYQGAASATGDQGAASATGTQGAASATGDQGAASATGTRGAASATGDQGAASATGYQGAASATGDQGAASATGTRGAAMSSGFEGRVMGKEGNALFLVERTEWNGHVVNVWAGVAGRDGIKADTWYTLKDGQPIEC